MSKIIVTHPDNKALLEQAFAKAMPTPFHGFRPFGLINGMQVRFNEHMPRRKIREVWHPPVDRFIEYGPEDEASCRYFGLGTIEEIDEGPLFVEMDDPMRLFAMNPMPMLWEPRRMILSTGC